MLTSWQSKAALLLVINYNNGYCHNKSRTNIVINGGIHVAFKGPCVDAYVHEGLLYSRYEEH